MAGGRPARPRSQDTDLPALTSARHVTDSRQQDGKCHWAYDPTSKKQLTQIYPSDPSRQETLSHVKSFF